MNSPKSFQKHNAELSEHHMEDSLESMKNQPILSVKNEMHGNFFVFGMLYVFVHLGKDTLILSIVLKGVL